MKYLLIVLTLCMSSLTLKAEAPELSRKVEKEISKHFELEKLKTLKNRVLSNNDELFFNIYDGDSKVGLLVLTSAKGRYDKYDYMIIYNSDFEIELIKILVYRSQYGSEIMSRRWLRQFYNRQDDSLKYGSDIQAISGATFSASALTKEVNRINRILKEHVTD